MIRGILSILIVKLSVPLKSLKIDSRLKSLQFLPSNIAAVTTSKKDINRNLNSTYPSNLTFIY